MNRKPNIVYVFSDQQRYSALGCNGNKVVRTPNIDRIAQEGMAFDNAFSACPICSPYRAQILTGLYAHQNGVVCNEYKMRTDITTLPLELKKAGYRSAYIGKWHLGYGPYTEDKRYGFDYMAANNCNHDYYDCQYYINEEGPITKEGWEGTETTNYAIQFLKSHCKAYPDTPFMMMMSWTPPHWPYNRYPQEFNTYLPDEVDLSPNVPEQMADFACKEIAQYYGSCTALDAEFGRLMDALEKLGIVDNTIVCFTSDHGDHLSSHGYGKPSDYWMHHTMRGSKATPYEESIHVPFLIKWPGKIKPGQRNNVLFNSVDVMPTLLSLCGLTIPGEIFGKDLSGAALGGKCETPDSVYLQILGPGWPHRGKWLGYWRGVRTDRWVYARWWKDEVEPKLFDRLNDPYEMDNLYGKPEYAQIQEMMEKRLEQWMEYTNDPFDTGERDPKTGMLLLGQKFSDDKWNK